MGDADNSRDAASDKTEITLGLLNAVHENSAVTQRSVARQLGIALGLTNAYLKRCVKKGLIKVNQIPPNRYAYYLTPKGFSEKSRLTAEYFTSSFTYFRKARSQCSEMFAHCSDRGWRRIALFGISDLAEIATLCASEFDVELIGIVDAGRGGGTYARVRVVASLDALGAVDAVIVTDLTDPQRAYESLAGTLADPRVLTPAMLNVLRENGPRTEAVG